MNLKGSCKSTDKLTEYLRKKAKMHNYYKHYSSFKRIVSIREDKVLYIGRSNKWNDKNDKDEFEKINVDSINFCKCFSFSKEESVAMWMLYGGIDHCGGMIDFTRKGINSILHTPKIELGYFYDDNFVKLTELSRENFEIFVTDVIYYRQNKKGYFIKRADETVPIAPTEVIDDIFGCKKAYPWSYENECRLIVSINKELVDNKCETVKIDLKDLDLGKTFEDRLFFAPNYPYEDKMNSSQSSLHGTVEWDLCDRNNKKCKCKNCPKEETK